MAGKKILIIDDDDDFHILYGLFLKGESYGISHAYNGLEGLDRVEKEKPDVIILDMIMPVMDGEQFLLNLAEEKHTTGIPVIIASVNDKIPKKFFELGIKITALKKPFTIDVLLAEIKKMLPA